jgi:suppressor for copper-sensitivity B
MAAVSVAAAAADAQVTPWMENERAAVRLVSAVTAVGAARHIRFAVELRLKPGWKTYWRIPGESGMPPLFTWSGSRNVAAVAVTWPRPRRFVVAGMQGYGYAGRVVFPVGVALARPGAPVSLRLDLRYAACRDICVPEQAHLVLDLARGPAAPTPFADDIAAAAAAAPQPGAHFGWTVARSAIVAHAEGGRRRFVLVVDVASTGTPFEAPDLVAERAASPAPDPAPGPASGPAPAFGMATAKVSGAGRRVRFKLPFRGGDGAAPGRLRLTLIDGANCATFEVEPRPGP